MTPDHERATPRIEEINCDLCIIGAGVAGLNALFSASRYLSQNQKVVLVDRNPGAGGMWLSVYDYVRLHQPHPMFTAGNIAWTAGRDPSYLAARPEVVAHLKHCVETSRQRLAVDERYGYEYRSHDESGAGPDDVLVECAPLSANAPPLRIKTKKLVKAFGHDVRTKDALALSSNDVRSVSPDKHDLLGDEMRSSNAPVYIVGGGKTAMDTAHALITRFPNKQVSLLIGKGTMFACRDKLYPAGLRRWWGGTTPLSAFLDLAQRFDGRNEGEVLDRLRSNYTVSLVADSRRFMLGLLSEQENTVIARAARELIKDYLADVVDRDGRPTLLLKSGASRAIEPGSWIVNCTGYAFQNATPYEPYVSKSGKVVSVQPCSAIHVLSTIASYFLVHLAYLNQLKRLPLYELDFNALYRANRDVLSASIPTHALYNAALVIGAVPKSVLQEFGTDLELWYPAPRRLLDGVRFMQFQKRKPEHLKRSLDAIRERFDVRCGPLQHVGQA